MKFLRFSLIALISLIFLSPSCSALESPTERFYVNDFANILSEETEQYIFDESVKLENSTSAQIVVVTVPSLEGKAIEEYATELFRIYGIGDKEKNNGVLLLVSVGDRKLRIEVGYGLEGALPDAKAGRIRDNYLTPYLKDDKWDEGILNGYKAIFQVVAKEYNYDSSIAPEELDAASETPFSLYLFLFQFLLMFPAAILSNKIVPVKYTKNKKTRKATKNAKFFFFVLEAITVLVSFALLFSGGSGSFLAFFTFSFFSLMNYAISFGSASGGRSGYHGGSSGGWSSSSSSSGGSSFSGGGGSSGGGGASGSF